MRTFIVIGGMGFIGSNFVELLVRNNINDRVVVIDKQDNGNLDGIRSEIVFELCDVDDEKCKQLFDKYKCDIVISFVVSDKIKQYCSSIQRYFQILSYFDDLIIADITICIPYCLGRRQSSNQLIYKMIKSAINQECIAVFGDGSTERDWIYINNCCEAIFKLLDFNEKNTVYVIKPDFKISDRNLARKILEKFNLPFSFIEYADNKIELQTNKLNFSNMIVATDSRTILDVDGILNKTINWVKDNVNL